MKSLLRFFANSLRWVVKNPIMIFLVLLVLVFNHFSSASQLQLDPKTFFRGDLIWEAIGNAIQTYHMPNTFLFGAIGVLAAAAITVFETGTTFGIFRGESQPMARGVKYVFSMRFVSYLVYQTVVLALCSAVLLAIAYVAIVLVGLHGLTGAITVALAVALGYPLLYMALGTGATILATDASMADKRHFFRVALEPQNLKRLISFYLVRIGAEVAVSYLGLAIVHEFGLPSVISALVVLVAIAIPFSVIRTAAFLLKLDIFSKESWFRGFFSGFYESRDVMERT